MNSGTKLDIVSPPFPFGRQIPHPPPSPFLSTDAMSSPLKLRLSPAVESTLRRLREERSLAAPDASALERLGSLPEETALAILNEIAAGRVTNLSASIILAAKMYRGSGRTSGSASPAGSPVTPLERNGGTSLSLSPWLSECPFR